MTAAIEHIEVINPATQNVLGASIWSSDLRLAEHLAQQIEAGTVWINKHLDLAPDVPFGRCKQSGIGTKMGQDGLLEFTQRRTINIKKP